jgi:hypothetical protein
MFSGGHIMRNGIQFSFLTGSKLLRKCQTLAGLCLTVGVFAGQANAAVYPTGNLLTNPGFENNLLTGISNVDSSPFSTNIWGDEASTIVTATGGVTPSGGTQMLSMTTDFLTYTQTLQLVDVSAFSPDISAGLLAASFNAKFNVSSNIPAANAGVILQFLDSSHNLVGSTSSAGLILDNNASTWQQISLANIAVPVTAQYLEAQVLYNDASLAVNGQNNPGFVDDAVLTLDRSSTTPEPGSLMALIPAGSMLLFRRRRQSV